MPPSGPVGRLPEFVRRCGHRECEVPTSPFGQLISWSGVDAAVAFARMKVRMAAVFVVIVALALLVNAFVVARAKSAGRDLSEGDLDRVAGGTTYYGCAVTPDLTLKK